MFLFLLPYSKKQHRVSFKDCKEDRFSVRELEPFARLLEKCFVNGGSLAPLYRRFGDAFWESLEMWVLPQKVIEFAEQSSLVLSPLYGLIKPSACISYAPLSWSEEYDGKSLMDFWKPHLKNLSVDLFSDRVVFSFLPRRYLSLFKFNTAQKFVRFEYYTLSQKVKNPTRHHAYTVRYIWERGLGLSDLGRINFYDYKVEDIYEEGRTLVVRMRSEGRYRL